MAAAVSVHFATFRPTTTWLCGTMPLLLYVPWSRAGDWPLRGAHIPVSRQPFGGRCSSLAAAGGAAGACHPCGSLGAAAAHVLGGERDGTLVVQLHATGRCLFGEAEG